MTAVEPKRDERERLLRALIEYADDSGTFNPHFHRKEMMERLGVSEGQFNIMQARLGDDCCSYVGQHEGDARYMIHISQCLALRDQFDQQRIQQRRHNEVVCLTVVVAVLAVVIAVPVSKLIRLVTMLGVLLAALVCLRLLRR